MSQQFGLGLNFRQKSINLNIIKYREMQQPQNRDPNAAIKFAKKMVNLFQYLRDECHDFLLAYHEGRDYEKPIIQSNNKRIQKINKLQAKASGSDSEQQHSGQLKKPSSAFNLFYSENYHRIAQENPGNKCVNMMPIIHQEWKSLSQEERIPYLKRYQQIREKYYQQCARLGIVRRRNLNRERQQFERLMTKKNDSPIQKPFRSPFDELTKSHALEASKLDDESIDKVSVQDDEDIEEIEDVEDYNQIHPKNNNEIQGKQEYQILSDSNEELGENSEQTH